MVEIEIDVNVMRKDEVVILWVGLGIIILSLYIYRLLSTLNDQKESVFGVSGGGNCMSKFMPFPPFFIQLG